ncbi:hypothetical protein HGA11_07450 [Mycolicibacterium septicum DSM 44393]|uniref:Solute-binding protein family 5 domain-containing protein n=1 Tax=Mycolicibacterium septicum DSM 44393 TaxID=1341646 RepID=A0A7X6MLY0_9MYCO|nr:ABC transporter substrate-binding protein [Mycolicibacterium septicum]NKZ10811.1 hypothetical protein [Mycolicibacterium septicum DSM 44393]
MPPASTDRFFGAPLRRRDVLRVAGAAFATIGIGASVVACSPNGGSAAAGKKVYRFSTEVPVGDTDPLLVGEYNAMILVGLVNEWLVSQDKDGKLIPRLAESWSPSPDGLSWDFALRSGAKFNDGSALTATDVASTFSLLIAPDSGSPAKSTFEGVLSSVETVGDGVVRFKLSRPFGDFPYLLTNANAVVLPAGYQTGSWIDNPIGAGQFILSDYKPGVGANYSKNPHYWNADQILLDGVDITYYSDPQAPILAFQAGEIDHIDPLFPTSDPLSALDAQRYRMVDLGYQRFDGIFLNVTTAPFDDPAVRQAIAWGIDRKAIIDTVYAGYADLGNDTTYFPNYAIRPKGLEQREQNVDEVRRLLSGRNLAFTITTNNKQLAEAVSQQLNAIPGFDVSVEVQTTERYYGEQNSWLTAPLTATNWPWEIPSQFIADIYAKSALFNASHYANPALQNLSFEYDATSEASKRQDLATEIGRIQWEDVPLIVPAFVRSKLLLGPRVQGEFSGKVDYSTGFPFAGITVEG